MKNLDFSGLDSIQSKQPLPLDAPEEAKAEPIYNPIASQRQAEERCNAVYRAHQEAIHKAGQLRGEITKGITSGENVLNLFLKAIECISLMTGEELFYTSNKENLKAVYGVGLLEKPLLEAELSEVRQRLEMLRRKELEGEPEETLQRISNAVKAHENRERRLLEMLDK